jgi:xanthine dehydrogenase molybdopterin-binding subunit B
MKRGIALVPLKYEISYAGNFSALVSIYAVDGTVAVAHGGIECGQGINTKVSPTHNCFCVQIRGSFICFSVIVSNKLQTTIMFY